MNRWTIHFAQWNCCLWTEFPLIMNRESPLIMKRIFVDYEQNLSNNEQRIFADMNRIVADHKHKIFADYEQNLLWLYLCWLWAEYSLIMNRISADYEQNLRWLWTDSQLIFNRISADYERNLLWRHESAACAQYGISTTIREFFAVLWCAFTPHSSSVATWPESLLPPYHAPSPKTPL